MSREHAKVYARRRVLMKHGQPIPSTLNVLHSAVTLKTLIKNQVESGTQIAIDTLLPIYTTQSIPLYSFPMSGIITSVMAKIGTGSIALFSSLIKDSMAIDATLDMFGLQVLSEDFIESCAPAYKFTLEQFPTTIVGNRPWSRVKDQLNVTISQISRQGFQCLAINYDQMP